MVGRLVAAAETGGGFRFAQQSRIEDDSDARTVSACPLGEGEAVVVACQTRVSEQHVDLGAVLKQGLGLPTARCLDDAEAAVAQVFRDRDAEDHVVFGDKDGRAAVADLC